ncbi:hypothetical protein C8R44DRAFT_859919 [Mycena epipterygia]|nr:hypothetical protein C8R44DRAFT_859919 [Mycena epipterygia]
MKTEPPSMKAEAASDGDTISAAAAVLARAVDQAKRAIMTARNEPSPASIALVASQTKCDSQEHIIADLRTQLSEFSSTHESQQRELDAALALTVERDRELGDKSRAITELEDQRTALRTQVSTLRSSAQAHTQVLASGWTNLAKAQEILRVERASLEAERLKLAAEQETLAADQAKLVADQAKLLRDRRATMTSLQRTVSTMQAEVAQQQRAMEKQASPSDVPPAPISVRELQHGANPVCPPTHLVKKFKQDSGVEARNRRYRDHYDPLKFHGVYRDIPRPHFAPGSICKHHPGKRPISGNAFLARSTSIGSTIKTNKRKKDTYNHIPMQLVNDTADSDDDDVEGAQERFRLLIADIWRLKDFNGIVDVRIKPAVPLFVDAGCVEGQTTEEACAKISEKGRTFVASWSTQNRVKRLAVSRRPLYF